jgi:hypothetical protein
VTGPKAQKNLLFLKIHPHTLPPIDISSASNHMKIWQWVAVKQTKKREFAATFNR